MASDFARRADGASGRRHWTRRKALAWSGGGVAVLAVALLGIYEGLPGTAAGLAGDQRAATVYYADGTTVIGTFAAPSANPDGAPWSPYLMTQVENELTGLDGVSRAQLQAGGLKVVTTISRPLEAGLYRAVDENLAASSIARTAGATVSALPPWVRVGAELQDPATGEILAEYPGPGTSLPAAQCEIAECDANTAAYTREQPGSSFTPYVLAAAVQQGMDVKTSTLNASPELCVPPDTRASALSAVAAVGTERCPEPDYLRVSNSGAVTGAPETGASATVPATVQNAVAQSSDTALADLAHRVGTAKIAAMAGRLGVNLVPYSQGGSGLAFYVGSDEMALGVAPLTVNEQATMLSAIADGGRYRQAHIVRYWQQGAGGAEQPAKFASHEVLPANLDADVQYAMEDVTARTAVTFGQGDPGALIGVPGTTAGARTGFFLGATTRYSLAVGMFTSSPAFGSAEKLSVLGGGAADYWPEKIWNTFAEAEFSTATPVFPANPAFYGSAWNQVPGTGA